MKTTVFLITTRRGQARITKTNPALARDEIAIRISLEIPDSAFQSPILAAEMVIPESAVITPVIVLEAIDAHQEKTS